MLNCLFPSIRRIPLSLLALLVWSGTAAARPTDELWSDLDSPAIEAGEVTSAPEAPSAPSAPKEEATAEPKEETTGEPSVSAEEQAAAPEQVATPETAPATKQTAVSAEPAASEPTEAAVEVAAPAVVDPNAEAAQKIAIVAADTTSAARRESAAAQRLELLGAVKVSQVAGVTALDSYRSPRKALFLSLLLPGMGQFYIGNSIGTQIRGGVYLALEAALIIGWWKIGVEGYDDKIAEARAWSKQHFDAAQQETRLRTLYKEAVNADGVDDFKKTNMAYRERWCQSLYSAGEERSRGICAAPGNQDFDNHIAQISTPEFSPYDRSGYELLLETGDLLLGWDDTRSLTIDFSTPLTSLVSQRQERYRDLRDDANHAADLQTIFIGGIILNHILSAVDAALTAHFHNQKLYERQASATPQRIRLAGWTSWGSSGPESRIAAALSF